MQEISNKHKLNDLIIALKEIPEEIWGFYQFRRDFFAQKIPLSDQKKLAKKAVECGISKAIEIRKKYPMKSILEIFEALQVPVTYCEAENTRDRILFATYDQELGVRVMQEPIEKIKQYKDEITAIPMEKVTELILGHELFHHLETIDETIYTQTQTIDLWRLLFYTHRSTIRALSEIAAMSFSKTLNQVDFSPYLLEVAMVWPYDRQKSECLFSELQEIYKQK